MKVLIKKSRTCPIQDIGRLLQLFRRKVEIPLLDSIAREGKDGRVVARTESVGAEDDVFVLVTAG